MQTLEITRITETELDVLIEEKMLKVFEKQKSEQSVQATEQLLNIEQAAKFLSLTVPTLYSKVSKREIPFLKQSKRLYFSSVDLMKFLRDGKRKSIAELEAEADKYLSEKK